MTILNIPDTVRASIYVVDDAPYLTELYTALLEAAGHHVRAFNDRAEALTALKVDRTSPDLLITDYCGRSLPIDWFLQQCLVIHPELIILMATGLDQSDLQFSRTRPDRFLLKPFSLEEFQKEVSAALAA